MQLVSSHINELPRLNVKADIIDTTPDYWHHKRLKALNIFHNKC